MLSHSVGDSGYYKAVRLHIKTIQYNCFIAELSLLMLIFLQSITTSSRDIKGAGEAHEVNPATIFQNDNKIALAR